MRQDLKVEIEIPSLAAWNGNLEQFVQLDKHILTFTSKSADPELRNVSSNRNETKDNLKPNSGKVIEYVYEGNQFQENLVYHPYIKFYAKVGTLSVSPVEIQCDVNTETNNYLDTSRWICKNSREISLNQLCNGYYE